MLTTHTPKSTATPRVRTSSRKLSAARFTRSRSPSKRQNVKLPSYCIQSGGISSSIFFSPSTDLPHSTAAGDLEPTSELTAMSSSPLIHSSLYRASPSVYSEQMASSIQPTNHWLVIGLGNHGDRYSSTRHNIGQDIVKNVSQRLDVGALSLSSADCLHTPSFRLDSLSSETQAKIILGASFPTLKSPKRQQMQQQLHQERQDQQQQQPVPEPKQQSSQGPELSELKQEVPNSSHHTIKSKKSNRTNNSPPLLTNIPGNIVVTFAITTSFMNNSGSYIAKLMKSLRISPEHLIVLYDDMDLELGKMRIKNSGSSGGQRGVHDLLAHLGNNSPFIRLRLGIGRPPPYQEVSDYVLQRFTFQENQECAFIREYVATALTQIMLYGPTLANNHMQNIHRGYLQSKRPPPPPKVAPVSKPRVNNQEPPSNPNINIFDYI